jgi:hypothetical protein
LERRLLLVEGIDDVHFVNAVAPQSFQSLGIEVKQAGGFDELIKQVSVAFKTSDLTRLGFIADADDNLLGRWQALSSRIAEAGVTGWPRHPAEAGAVLDHGGVRVGVWLMPNNQSDGCLEDAVRTLIPDADPMLSRSDAFVGDIPASERRFKPSYLPKAQLQAWLAIQRDPRIRVGQAIRAGLLDGDGPALAGFRAWLASMFTG